MRYAIGMKTGSKTNAHNATHRHFAHIVRVCFYAATMSFT